MKAADLRDAFHQHKSIVYRYAYRMTRSRAWAEDIVQESFLALWQERAQYDPERGDVRNFLIGVARNKILMRWREERRHAALENRVTMPPSAAAEAINVIGNERSDIVARAVASLPPLQREVLILAEYEELSLDEIASATGAELAAVKSRLHRARQSLRRTLGPLLESKGTVYGTRS